jgi:hypothetical protein
MDFILPVLVDLLNDLTASKIVERDAVVFLEMSIVIRYFFDNFVF